MIGMLENFIEDLKILEGFHNDNDRIALQETLDDLIDAWQGKLDIEIEEAKKQYTLDLLEHCHK